MDAISVPIITAIGAITAALITACFSYLNLIVSKEQKVSEFRQQWIDAFRKELADLTAAVFFIKYHYASHEFDHGPAAERSDLSKSLQESHEKYAFAVTSILLRINPAEPDQTQHIRNTIF